MSAATDERARIVSWLRKDALQCDCFAHEPEDCVCGAWDDNKRVEQLVIADRIENYDDDD